MNKTYQHRVIGRLLQRAFGHMPNWPFSSTTEIEEELSRKNLSLAVGDYLIVGLDRKGVRCGKASDFQELAEFSAESLVIPYHELERVFYEEHADYVEL